MPTRLCDQLNDTASLLDLALSITAEVSGADNDGDVRDAALAEDLGVAEREKVDDGSGVGLLSAQVGLTLLGGDERPELYTTHFESAQICPCQSHISCPQLFPFFSSRPKTPVSTPQCFHRNGLLPENVPCRG